MAGLETPCFDSPYGACEGEILILEFKAWANLQQKIPPRGHKMCYFVIQK